MLPASGWVLPMRTTGGRREWVGEPGWTFILLALSLQGLCGLIIPWQVTAPSGSPYHLALSFSGLCYGQLYQSLSNIPGISSPSRGVSSSGYQPQKYCITPRGFPIHFENSTFINCPHIKGKKKVTRFLKDLMMNSRKQPSIIRAKMAESIFQGQRWRLFSLYDQ